MKPPQPESEIPDILSPRPARAAVPLGRRLVGAAMAVVGAGALCWLELMVLRSNDPKGVLVSLGIPRTLLLEFSALFMFAAGLALALKRPSLPPSFPPGLRDRR
jgi:hypothetical protein